MANGATDLTNLSGFNTGLYNTASDPLASGIGGGTQDALSRLQQLQSALQSGQIDYNTYQQLFQQFDPSTLSELNNITTQGSNAANQAKGAGLGTFQNLSQLGGQDLSSFAGQLQNLTGQAPTAEDITNYFNNVGGILSSQPGGANSATYTDVNSIINQYLQNQYGPQIQAYQQQQQQNALNTAQNQAQNLVQQQNQATVNQLSSPAVQQQILGSLNNSGQANSGAFQTTLANDLANAAQGNISNVLGGVTIPGITGQESTTNQPYQSYLSNLNPNLQSYGNEQNQYSEFNLESSLANQLAQLSQPSTLTQLAPILQGALQGGGQAAAGSKCFLCHHLMDLGLATIKEVKQVHRIIKKSFLAHPQDFFAYYLLAPIFIVKANFIGFDWKSIKPLIIDGVISEKDHQLAYQKYKNHCKDLFLSIIPEFKFLYAWR